MSRNKTARENIIYVYATEPNKKFVKGLSIENNVPESEILNLMIESIREKKKFDVRLAVPAFVRKAEEWTRKHVEQLKALKVKK